MRFLIQDLRDGIHFRVVVADHELDELVLAEDLGPQTDELEASLDHIRFFR